MVAIWPGTGWPMPEQSPASTVDSNFVMMASLISTLIIGSLFIIMATMPNYTLRGGKSK
jgi:hypothetical protein